MKKIALLLLVAALAAVALYFSLSAPAPELQAPQLPGSGPSAHAPNAAESKTGQIVAPSAEQANPHAAEASQREVRGRELSALLAPEKICTLSVHATLPSGTPRDDEAEIMVFDVPTDDSIVVDEVLATLKPDDPLPKWLIARAPFEPNGVTEIKLERRALAVGVGLRGRYTYAEPVLAVAISGERGETNLDAKLGAYVRGRMLPPADATDTERDFSAAKLHLNSDPMASAGVQNTRDRSTIVDRRSVAAADGSFEIRGVNPSKNLTLTGRPEHLAAFKSTIAELTAGKVFELSIPLTHGATATGKVVDEAGASVGGAKLSVRADAFMWGMGGRTLREGQSNADGSFTLEAIGAGKAMIDTKKDGYLDSSQEVEFVEGGRMGELVLHLVNGARIAGHVRWKDGTNAVDAKVDVEFDQAGLTGMGALNARYGAKGNGRTDEQGKFSVGGLGKGPFSVKVSAKPADAKPDDDSADWTAQVDGIKPGTLDVELTLLPSCNVSGAVVDDTGAPVAVCTVVVAPKPRNPFIPSSDKREIPVHDDQGHFSVNGLKSGAYTALARDKTGLESAIVPFQLPLETQDGSVLITLPRPASVSGRVLLPDGTPAASAHVHQQLGLADMTRGKLPGSEPAGDTDADGAFKLQSLPMGASMLQATKDGYAPSDGVPLNLTPAQQVADITITLRLGGTITGEVYDDKGSPKAGARILSQMPDLRFGQMWAQSDAAGKFEFLHVAPGQWQVMSFDENTGSGDAGDDAAAMSDMLKHIKLAMASVKDAETVHVVLGAPPKNPVHVRARVTSANAPVSGAMVSFIPSEGGSAGGTLSSLKMSASDKDGRLELDLDHSGSWLVTVQKLSGIGGQQSIEFSREVPDLPDYSLELELPLGSISGRVTDQAGNAVVGARVSLSPDGALKAGTITGGRFSELQTDERGEFLLEWLTPGRYTVAAGGALFVGIPSEHVPLGRQVRDGIEVAADQRISGVDFRLRTACELKGKVLDSGGQPVAEASIFLRDEAGRPVDRLSMTSTDAGGGFIQRGLDAGRYTVSARTSELVSSDESSVLLREGEPAEVDLHVSSGSMLIITLTGAEGAAIDASFSVVDEKGRQVSGLYSLTDMMKVMSEGAFDAKHQRVGPLPAGKYTITASASDGTQVTKLVTVNGKTERKIILKLGD